MTLLQFTQKLFSHLKTDATTSENQFIFLGVMGFLYHPLFYVLWTFIHPQPYENLYLRLIGCLSCGILMLGKYWPKSLKHYLLLYFHLVIFFNLAFYFNFMLLENNLDTVWITSTFAALFITIIAVEWIWIFFLFLTGALLAWYVFLLCGGNGDMATGYFSIFLVYVFIAIIRSVFMYNSVQMQNEKLEGMITLSGNIAHELRTPLLGIKSGITGLKKYLPLLCDAYETAKSSQLDVAPIRKNHFNNLNPTLERMDAEIRFANTIIDMLLMNVDQNKIQQESFVVSSVAEPISNALARYPFDSAELEAKLHVDLSNDFLFKGTPLLLEHVIFNLMKNALYFIVKAEKGGIFLWLEQKSKFNELHFKDTGQGIPAEIMPKLFSQFFTTTLTGTGIGLYFCKLVMKGFGGSIICRSVEGEFTEFILRFPIAMENQF